MPDKRWFEYAETAWGQDWKQVFGVAAATYFTIVSAVWYEKLRPHHEATSSTHKE